MTGPGSSGQLEEARSVGELMDGVDLAQHLAEHGPLRAEELVRLINPLCGSLEQLQARGLRCKDLTPANVFLAGGLGAFSPKLTGHGLSDFATELSTEETLRDDVRALGELMHWAYTGTPYTSGQFAFPEHPRPENAWVEPIIRRCVATQPGDRYETPLDVAQALQDELPVAAQPPLLLVEEAAREKEGDVLGNYQLIRLLGEGTMGRVFLARHMRLHRMVALKILRAEHALNSGLIQRFFQEARAVNEVSHEHIVEIDDFVEEQSPHGGKRVYCVMELLEGRSLTDVMRDDGSLTITRMVKLIRQLCRALAASHAVGVIHRDIKPDNLFVITRAGDPDFLKVLDFGVAKLQMQLGEMPKTATLAGAIVGTPSYMAPEQAEGQETDGRADLYSVGTVLYEMLSGACPFPGPSIGQLIAQVLTMEPPPLPARTPAGEPIPPQLRAIVMRALAKRPADRYSDMQAFEAALTDFEIEQSRPRRLLQRMPAWTPRAAAVVLASAVLAWVSEAHVPSAFVSHRPTEVSTAHPVPAQPVQAAPIPEPPPAMVVPAPPSAAVAPASSARHHRSTVSSKHVKEKPSRDAVVDPFAL